MTDWEAFAAAHLGVDTDNVFNYYSQFIVKKNLTGVSGRVFKCDLNNEALSIHRDILSGLGCEVYGVDLSRLVCKTAHGRNPTLGVVCGVIQALPFRPGVFDWVLDCSTIDHVDRAAAGVAVADYMRVLSGCGRLFMYYAQESGFSRYFWRNNEGVFLHKPFSLDGAVCDCGFDFLCGFSCFPPKRLFERLLYHLPKRTWRVFSECLFKLERLMGAVLRGLCCFRLQVAVKGAA